jgi:hypothetical protein
VFAIALTQADCLYEFMASGKLEKNAVIDRNATQLSIAFQHFQKAGGSTMRVIFRDLKLKGALGPETHVLMAHEYDGFERRDSEHLTFTIGLTREPCSWYTSLWSYGTKGSFNQGIKNFDRYLPPNRQLDTLSAVPYFQRWLVEQALQVKHIGFMTLQFASNYVNVNEYDGPDAHGVRPIHRAGELSLRYVRLPGGGAAATATIRRDVDQFLMGDRKRGTRIDCWVRTSMQSSDLEVCLRKFFQRQKDRLPPPDWNLVRSIVEEQVQNASPSRLSCHEYFADDRNTSSATSDSSFLAELVRQKDEPIFRHFNFTCCGAPHNRN